MCGALAACSAAAPAPKIPPAGYAFPALTGRVVDAADVLPQTQEAKLAAQLASVEMQTKHQFVVVTVPSLGGHEILDYSVTLARFWSLGRAEADDGVMLLIAPTERKARIEVGYGLEASLKDQEAAEIMRAAIIPQFKAGNMAGGILAGSEAIIREIS